MRFAAEPFSDDGRDLTHELEFFASAARRAKVGAKLGHRVLAARARLEVGCSSAAAAFAALEPEWSALAARLRPRLPFQTWPWNEAWWKPRARQRAPRAVPG